MSKDKKNKKEKDNNKKKKISYLKTKISLSFAQTTETAQSSQEASWCCPLEALNRNKLNSWWKNIVQICKCRSLSSPIWTCATKTKNQCRLERNTSTTTGITECQGVIAPQWNKTPEIEQDVLTGSQKVIALWSRHNYWVIIKHHSGTWCSINNTVICL